MTLEGRPVSDLYIMFRHQEANHLTKPQCSTTWNNTDPESKYSETKTPQSGNDAPNNDAINFWSKENHKKNICANDRVA